MLPVAASAQCVGVLAPPPPPAAPLPRGSGGRPAPGCLPASRMSCPAMHCCACHAHCNGCRSSSASTHCSSCAHVSLLLESRPALLQFTAHRFPAMACPAGAAQRVQRARLRARLLHRPLCSRWKVQGQRRARLHALCGGALEQGGRGREWKGQWGERGELGTSWCFRRWVYALQLVQLRNGAGRWRSSRHMCKLGHDISA